MQIRALCRFIQHSIVGILVFHVHMFPKNTLNPVGYLT